MKIRASLLTDEQVVHTHSGGFSFSSISVVGTHTLCLTNQGRVFVHDTGGLFGTDTVHNIACNPGKIRITQFMDRLVTLEGKDSFPFGFKILLSIPDFEKCLNQMPAECFQFPIDAASEIPVYATYGSETNAYMKLGLKADQFELMTGSVIANKIYTIPYHRITAANRIDAFHLKLDGFFDLEWTTIPSIQLFIPQQDKLLALLALQQKAPKLQELIGSFQELYPMSYSGRFNGIKHEGQEGTLALGNDLTITIVDESKWSVIHRFQLKMDDWYYENELNRTLVVQQGTPYVIDVKRADAITFARKTWMKPEQIFHQQIGTLQGVLFGEQYDGQEVGFLLNRTKNRMQLLLNKQMKLLPAVSLQECGMIEADNRLFMLRELEIAMIVGQESSYSLLFGSGIVKPPDSQMMGYTLMNQPFFYELSERGLTFRQGQNMVLQNVDNEEITNISVSEPLSENSYFVGVTIRINSNKEGILYKLPTHAVPGLIYEKYRQRKAPLLPQIPPAQLYLSWCRQMNDFALYNMFGQIFALQAGIREIEDNVTNREERNNRLLNFLYYAIQNQKRRLDQVSIYLPAMLESNSRELLTEAGLTSSEEPFRLMQRGFMGIGSQLKQSLAEIESILSAVYPLLIPKADMERFIRKEEKQGYARAAVTTGIGLAVTIGSGGLALPLLLGGAFLGVGAASKARDTREKQLLKAEYDHDRLDFYMTKALDTLEHLMNTLIPFHVAEANRYMSASFERLAPPYKTALLQQEAVERLFTDIARHYTYKQLPIDDSVVMSRSELMESVQASTGTANELIQLFQQEVNYDVSKQAKRPQLRSI
ncbi:hypothetical protein [Paenibacillus castaneae]|uniref:hypothetical protein n=1 Tax=Paenibacillus castaneae TaxID=474957 RepID=UPI001ABA51EC|nr:hypothetical protein [Paenibacillus castaneae]